MKSLRILSLLAGLLVSACARSDRETAALQHYYAEKGDQMAAAASKLEQRNPQKGTTPHLSTATPSPD